MRTLLFALGITMVVFACVWAFILWCLGPADPVFPVLTYTKSLAVCGWAAFVGMYLMFITRV